MWYSGQVRGTLINREQEFYIDETNAFSWLGYGQSKDGIHWETREQPVMKPTQPWEKKSLMCPHVMYDEEMKKYRMWYSAGDWFEPDAIGYAQSDDGVAWTKFERNPIMTPDPRALWERERTTACQVIRHKDWHYMFYIGFEDIDKARICSARSKDGVTDWQRHPDKPDSQWRPRRCLGL